MYLNIKKKEKEFRKYSDKEGFPDVQEQIFQSLGLWKINL